MRPLPMKKVLLQILARDTFGNASRVWTKLLNACMVKIMEANFTCKLGKKYWFCENIIIEENYYNIIQYLLKK